MKKSTLVLAVLFTTLLSVGVAQAETAIGAVFGNPGNAVLSLRFDRTPIGVAWSSDFVRATLNRWMKQTSARSWIGTSVSAPSVSGVCSGNS